MAAWPCAADDQTTNDWGPATNNVRMSIAASAAYSAISAGDIADFSGLIERLAGQTDPFSSFLWERLSNDEQSVLKNYKPSVGSSNQVLSVLLQALNRVIGGSLLFTSERFKGIVLGAEAQQIMHEGPLGTLQQVALGPWISNLNRLLLKDAYPGVFSRSTGQGETTIKISQGVELTITLTNMWTSDEKFGIPPGGDSFVVVTPSGKQMFPQGNALFFGNGRSFLDSNRLKRHTFRFNLSSICKFDEMGVYTIVVEKPLYWHSRNEAVFDRDGSKVGDRTILEWFSVKSNPLTIKIVADE